MMRSGEFSGDGRRGEEGMGSLGGGVGVASEEFQPPDSSSEHNFQSNFAKRNYGNPNFIPPN
jgi:hypothetical protein